MQRLAILLGDWLAEQFTVLGGFWWFRDEG
jgi:hypothetical protein